MTFPAPRPHTDHLRASVVLDCYAEYDEYDEAYNVTHEEVGQHYHGPLVRFSGTQGDLRRMVAECWTLRLSFDDGAPTLSDPEVTGPDDDEVTW